MGWTLPIRGVRQAQVCAGKIAQQAKLFGYRRFYASEAGFRSKPESTYSLLHSSDNEAAGHTASLLFLPAQSSSRVTEVSEIDGREFFLVRVHCQAIQQA